MYKLLLLSLSVIGVANANSDEVLDPAFSIGNVKKLVDGAFVAQKHSSSSHVTTASSHTANSYTSSSYSASSHAARSHTSSTHSTSSNTASSNTRTSPEIKMSNNVPVLTDEINPLPDEYVVNKVEVMIDKKKVVLNENNNVHEVKHESKLHVVKGSKEGEEIKKSTSTATTIQETIVLPEEKNKAKVIEHKEQQLDNKKQEDVKEEEERESTTIVVGKESLQKAIENFQSSNNSSLIYSSAEILLVFIQNQLVKPELKIYTPSPTFVKYVSTVPFAKEILSSIGFVEDAGGKYLLWKYSNLEEGKELVRDAIEMLKKVKGPYRH